MSSVLDLALLRQGVNHQEARRLRLKANILVREMAKEVGVDPATMSRYEAGSQRPQGETLDRWAAAIADLRRVVG